MWAVMVLYPGPANAASPAVPTNATRLDGGAGSVAAGSIGSLRLHDLPPLGQRRSARCRRWQDVAASLGETFAGYALRTSLRRTQCALASQEVVEPEFWDWPWRTPSRISVPPHAHRDFDAWAIRCGGGAMRHRCALLLRDPATSSVAHEMSAAMVTAHFVIDRVAGREVLLWRLIVRHHGPSARGRGEARPSPVASLASAGGSQRRPPGRHDGSAKPLTLRIAGEYQTEQPMHCMAGLCSFEVRAERAGRIATRLADGGGVDIELMSASGGVRQFQLEASGFDKGLAELIRLRRAEHAQTPGRSR
jgi:hypothetical protein